jgi:chemotaxis protein methyltransferase CheR
MYFNAADQEEVLGRFAAALPSGGMLVLGRTETLRDSAGLFAPINAQERIYQRV